jgi:hypothetical protein
MLAPSLVTLRFTPGARVSPRPKSRKISALPPSRSEKRHHPATAYKSGILGLKERRIYSHLSRLMVLRIK